MFTVGLSESEAGCLTLDNVDGGCMEKVVEFMYTGSLTGMDTSLSSMLCSDNVIIFRNRKICQFVEECISMSFSDIHHHKLLDSIYWKFQYFAKNLMGLKTVMEQ